MCHFLTLGVPAFPPINFRLITDCITRWSYLRATEGWDALQYHSILHTTFNVTSTQAYPISGFRLYVQLQQGSFFAILPRENRKDFVPEWHAGNIYGLQHVSNNSVVVPAALKANEPMTFDLFVSGDYEVVRFLDNFAFSRPFKVFIDKAFRRSTRLWR